MSQENKNTYTSEQLAAIEAQGHTIVSASAGSGKTTVMIEKIIRFIADDGGNVDEVLAVTFTKKAASQMKEKLRKALVKAINAEGVNAERRAALKKQLDGVQSADISTIHSFCAKTLRTYFYAVGVDNAFRIINDEDAEGTALKNAALDEVFEEGYENKDEKFLHLLSVYWRKKSDNALRGILLSAYKTLRNRADYRAYLQASGSYDEATFERVCADLFLVLKRKCAYYKEYVEDERIYFEEEGKTPFELCKQLQSALDDVLQAPDYFTACALGKEKFSVVRGSKKDGEERRVHIQRLSALRAKVTDIFNELSTTGKREDELQAFLTSAKTAEALAACLLKFDDKFSEMKAERSVLDYNDLEHKTLQLLQSEERAKEIRSKYRYVFVDEYQDVNPVQEAIVSLVGGDNLFLVGDVKQSIYGFRGSKSKFFVEKQRTFAAEGGNSLLMKRNFRSSDAVLDAVNAQFSLAMTPQTCNVNYAVDSYMERGGRYPVGGGRVQIHCLPEEEKKEPPLRGVYSVMAHTGKQEREERASAKVIKHIIETERSRTWFNADTGWEERVRYCDIAILSRKKQGAIAKTVAALAAEGIPVASASTVNICDYAEIKTLIDILSLIDNAAQDIPLCSALLSAMGGCTLDDLADVRLAYPNERFFRTACSAYAREKTDLAAHKLRAFFERLDEARTLSGVLSAGELLTKLITDTRMEAHLLSKDNGAACLKRVHRFIEETTTDEPLSVHAFLQRLRNLDYNVPFNENAGEDSVKVLTMHSSKGLEYPVVILDDLNATFRGVDRDEVLVEEEYSLAPRAFDTENMLRKETLLRRLHDHKQQENSIVDELNLYYVALTRAKDTLHLLFKKRSAFADVKYARSFADFTDFSVWEKYVVQDELFDVPKQERMPLVFDPDQALAKRIMDAFTWEYAHAGYENLPVKSSATQLMDDGAIETDYGADASQEERAKEWASTGATGKERGVAYHAFLERVDFSRLTEKGERVSPERRAALVRETLAAMEAEGKADVGLLDEGRCAEILNNDVFYRLQDKKTYKEQQFLAALPVKDTYAKYNARYAALTGADEDMLFQGAIDLLAVGTDEAWIVDYKYSVKTADALREKYAPQLELYRQATAKILHLPLERVHGCIVNIYHGFQTDLF